MKLEVNKSSLLEEMGLGTKVGLGLAGTAGGAYGAQHLMNKNSGHVSEPVKVEPQQVVTPITDATKSQDYMKSLNINSHEDYNKHLNNKSFDVNNPAAKEYTDKFGTAPAKKIESNIKPADENISTINNDQTPVTGPLKKEDIITSTLVKKEPEVTGNQYDFSGTNNLQKAVQAQSGETQFLKKMGIDINNNPTKQQENNFDNMGENIYQG